MFLLKYIILFFCLKLVVANFELEAECTSNCGEDGSLVNPSEPVQLYAKCTGSCTGIKYSWKMDVSASNKKKELKPDDVADIKSQALVIYRDKLMPNDTYTIFCYGKKGSTSKSHFIQLKMDKCSTLYPCDETTTTTTTTSTTPTIFTIASNTRTTTTTTTTTVKPTELLTNITNETGELQTIDTNSEEFHTKQGDLMTKLKQMPLEDPKIVQQTAKAANKIVSASTDIIKPHIAETTADVTEKVVNAELLRVEKSDNPAALAPEVKELSKVILNTISKTVHEDEKQLVDHRVPDTTVSSASDEAPYTENYPIYDDFDIPYQEKKENMKAVSQGTINAINNLALTNARTMPGRTDVEQIIESDICLLMVVNKPNEIKNKTYQICDASLYMQENVTRELKGKMNTAAITFGVLKKNPFWWNLKKLSTDIITLEVRNDVWKKISVDNPIQFYVKLKDIQPVFITGSVQIPLNTTDEDEPFCVHQILVQRKIKKLMIEFKNLNTNDEIQVVIFKNHRPSIEDFSNLYSVPSKKKITDKYLIIHNILADSGSFIYIGVLPTKETVLTSGSIVDNVRYYNYSVQFSSVACVRWDEKQTDWLDDYCNVGSQTNTETLYCNCMHLSTFAGAADNVDSKVDRMLAINFQLERIYNYVVLITVIVITVFYILVLLFALWMDRKRSKSKKVLFLLDNHLDFEYEYLIVVHTGTYANSGTTANIGIKLYGTMTDTECHLLRGHVEPVLQKGSEDWFLLLTASSLGNLVKVDLWTDCYGVRSSWYCKKVIVYNLKENKEWIVNFNKWLSILNNTIYYSANVLAVETYVPDTKWDYAKQGFKQDHLWFSLFKRSKCPAFTYTEKITLIYGIIILNMFITYLFYAGSVTIELYGQLGHGHYEFGIYDFGIAFLSSCITFLISYALIYLFSNANPISSNLPVEHTYSLPRIWRYISWIFLVALILVSVIILLTFGLWFSYISSIIWLTTSSVAIILCACVFETARVMIISVIKREVPTFQLDKTLDMSEINPQKQSLLKRHGVVSMRPLFQTLYSPLSDFEIKIKKEKELQRIELRNIVLDIIMFSIYLVILFCVVLINRDSMAHYSSENILNMFVEDKFIRHMSLEEINVDYRFYNYMRETFVPAAYARKWYGNWSTNEAGLTKDFNTKLLGIPRIRQIRIRNNSCTVPGAMQFAAEHCNAEYSSSIQSKIDFGPRWTSKAGDTKSRHMVVWLYRDGWQSESSAVTGELAYYPAGGYIAELGRTRQNAFMVLNYLRRTNWIDHLTRALFVEVNFYNANQNLFNILTLIIEKSATGKFVSSYSIITSKLLFLNDELAISTFLTFTLFIAMLLVFSWKRIKQIKKKFIADVWNIIDLTIILLAFAFLLIFFLRSRAVSKLLKTLEDAAHNEFVSFTNALAWDTWTTILATLLVTVSTIRAWRLLRFLRFFRICELTLALAMKYLLAMAFSKCILLFAYGAWGYVIFNAYSKDFHSVFKSFVSLILLSIGFNSSFDYTVLDRSYIGYVYYFSFMIILLVVINIYITIILVAYKTAQDYFDNSDKEKLISYNIVQYLKDEFRYYTNKNKGREIMDNLRGGEDIVVDEGTEIKFKPDAPRDVIRISEERMKILHNITAKVLEILVHRFDRKSDINPNPNDNELVADILDHLLTNPSSTEEDNEGNEELYIVVPDEEGNKFCSKKRQDDMLVIVEYLLRRSGESSEGSSSVPTTTTDKHCSILISMNHRVDRMIKRIEEMSTQMFQETSTLARFEDFGLEIDESDENINNVL